MIKAAFFDIDGTLLAHGIGGVPVDTRYALSGLKKRGIRVFTCTGAIFWNLTSWKLRALASTAMCF